MASPPSSVLLAAVATSAVLSLVFLIGFSPDRSSAGGNPAVAAQLVDELRQLREERRRTAMVLDRLATTLGAMSASTTADPGRVPVGELPTDRSFEALATSLDRLRETLDRELTETQAVIRAAPAFGGESLVSVRDRRVETNWIALDRLRDQWRIDKEAADRSQYFQTPRDLMETYGAPTAIYRPPHGMLFHYRRPGSGPSDSWYFRIQDGFVVEFFFELDGEDDK